MVRRDGEYGWSMFGEMEQNSLPRKGFRAMVKKVANMFAKNDFPQKRTSKEYPAGNYPFFPFFAPFLPNFITFYISQHYGRHVTTSLLRHQEHKGNPAEIGRADAEEVMMFLFFKSKAGFSKLDIYFCPFLKTGGRNVKKTSTSSLRA